MIPIVKRLDKDDCPRHKVVGKVVAVGEDNDGIVKIRPLTQAELLTLECTCGGRET